MSAVWALTPRRSIERECARRGRADVVADSYWLRVWGVRGLLWAGDGAR